jgi:hypothetical protein
VKIATSKNKFASRSLPALAVVGGSLAAFPAAAIELGELTVQSRLGQPLRASIAFALAPNEQVSNNCVTLRPGASVSGLPSIGNAALNIASGVIMLRGTTPIREPMVSAHVVINCPYSANLSREYMLFIDPATPVYEQASVTQQVAAKATPVAVAPAPVVASVRKAPVEKDIGLATNHVVQSGETLSEIAQRIENRGIGLWAAVDVIFQANPHAFTNNDVDQLKAGSSLAIPSFDGSAAVVVNVGSDPVVSDSTNIALNDMATTTVAGSNAEAYGPAAAAESQASVTTNDLKPGAVTVEDNPFVEVGAVESIVIPDTSLEGPTTSSASPNVPTAIITSTPVDDTATPSWVLWLAGTGIALVIGLLMFSRRLRKEADDAPLLPAAGEVNRRKLTDIEPEQDTASLAAIGIDHDLGDESPTEENLALDADLVIGTGLDTAQESGDSPDFGFAATTALDFELPFEPIASASDKTDILPPLRTSDFSILESEVLPEDEDNYDMSILIDATKMPQQDDVTEHDLKAVEIVPEDETMISNNYTINKEVDYQVLEQDYEDEMTATQALNLEIARAALELNDHMDDEEDSSDKTSELPLASVTDLDVTVQLPAQNDDDSKPEDTGITQETTINQDTGDETVEMPATFKKSK